MSFMQKKYDTPIELHRILGNTFAAEQAEKTQLRKQKRVMQKTNKRNAAKASFPSGQYFDQIMLKRQLQLEMELERLRGLIPEGSISDSLADGTSFFEETTQEPLYSYQQQQAQVLPPLVSGTPVRDARSESVRSNASQAPALSLEVSPEVPEHHHHHHHHQHHHKKGSKSAASSRESNVSGRGMTSAPQADAVQYRQENYEIPQGARLSDVSVSNSARQGPGAADRAENVRDDGSRGRESDRGDSSISILSNAVGGGSVGFDSGVQARGSDRGDSAVSIRSSATTVPVGRDNGATDRNSDRGDSAVSTRSAAVPGAEGYFRSVQSPRTENPMSAASADLRERVPSAQDTAFNANAIAFSQPPSKGTAPRQSPLVVDTAGSVPSQAPSSSAQAGVQPARQLTGASTVASAGGSLSAAPPTKALPPSSSNRSLHRPYPAAAPTSAMIYSPPTNQHESNQGTHHHHHGGHHGNHHGSQNGSQISQGGQSVYTQAPPQQLTVQQGYTNQTPGHPIGVPQQKQNQMYVLSAAPKLDFQSLLAQEARSYNSYQQYHGFEFPRFQQEQAHSPGSPGSLSMSMDCSISSDERSHRDQYGRTHPTIQEQIHRFAEIRALFQMPTSSDVDERYLSGGEEVVRRSPRPMRTDLMEEVAQSKLADSINRHKQRLVRSREPKPVGTMHQPSPRTRIHKARNPSRQDAPPSQPQLVRGGGQGSYYEVVEPPSTHRAQPGPMPTLTYDSPEPERYRTISESFMQSTVPPASIPAEPQAGTAPSELHQFGASASVAALPETVTAPAPLPSSPTVSLAGSVARRELTMEEFEREAARIEDALRKTVEETVRREILADAQSQHYTKRMQKAAATKAQKPLEEKIASKVEGKIAELQKELEALRGAKLAELAEAVKAQESVSELGDDMEDGYSVGGFDNRSRQLRGAKKSPPKSYGSPQHSVASDAEYQALQYDIKRSVEYVIKKHTRANPQLLAHAPPDLSQMVFGSQLEDRSRHEMDALPSPRKESEDSTVAPTPRKLSEESSVLYGAHRGVAMSDRVPGGVSSPSSMVSAAEPTTTQIPMQRRKQSDGSEATLGFESDVPPSPMTSPVAAQQSRKTVMNSIGGLLGSLGSAKSTRNVAGSSGPSAGAAAGSGASMRGRQISSLRPIVDVDEAEGSLVDMQSQARRNAEVQAVERELEQANANYSSLNDAKNKMKKELKDWQRDFTTRVGRTPSDADKSAIEDRFLFYQKLTADAKEAAGVVEEVTARLAAVTAARVQS